MNYYQHHIGDYLVETSHLTFVEDAAYSRLLRLYYHRETAFPADVAAVQRLSGARGKMEKAAVEIVLNEFFSLQDDGWHHAQADETIAHYQSKQELAQENGKKGGRPKSKTKPGDNPKQTRNKPKPDPTLSEKNQDLNPTLSEKNQDPNLTLSEKNQDPNLTNNHKPITNNHKPITNNQEPIKAKAKAKTSHATRERDEEKPDDNPEQTQAKPTPSRKREDCTLQQALDDNSAATGGERFIREDDPVFAWAEKIGLPEPFLELGWEEFQRRFLHSQKRQKDWRAHFRNACRRDWLGLWKTSSNGEFYLTQAGKQLERELDAEWEEHERARSPPAEPEPSPEDEGSDNTPSVIARLFTGDSALSIDKFLNASAPLRRPHERCLMESF